MMLLRVTVALIAASLMIVRPEDLPPAYAPWRPLDLRAQPTVVTPWKLRRLSADGALCLDALARTEAAVRAIPRREDSALCHITDGVRLTQLSESALAPVETRCEIAARLYQWERHDLQPAAEALLGTSVAEILHYQSYSCRRIRTASGIGAVMSQHATANAFDISGFVLADGRRISLRADWQGAGPEAAFLRAARDGLCRWFRVTLGPDFNRLHADHFHVDQGPSWICR